MKSRHILTSIVALSVGLTGAPVLAGGGDVVGGLIGGMIGAAIVNEANRSHTTRRTTTRRSTMSSAQREQNREVQNSLNYFGYPVGTADGVLGSKSRSAISQYQVLLGYPATGQLTEMERNILVTAYNRAQLGGPQVQNIIARSPQGVRGMLLAQRDEMMGGGANTGYAGYSGGTIGGLPPEVSEAVFEIARNTNVEPDQLLQRAGFVQLADMNADGRTDYMIDTSVTGSGFWCNGPACTVRVFASTPQGYQRNDFQVAGATPASFTCRHGLCEVKGGGTMAANPALPMPSPGAALPNTMMAAQPTAPAAPPMPSFAAATTPAPAPVMPNFGSAMAPPKVTLVSYCSGVKAKSGANGRPQTVAAMSDPALALGEQFCAVSAAAKADGEVLAGQIQGFTPEQIADQCRGFSAALKDQVAKLGTTPRDDVVSSIQSWIGQSGMAEDQLISTSKVCLSMGYGLDEPEMAIASALVLTGAGQMVYAEMLGHHLTSGVGMAAHPDLALEWYELGANALSVGQTPVFLPEQGDRASLIKKASMALNGRASAIPVLPIPVTAAPSVAPTAPAIPASAPSGTISTKSASGGIAGLASFAAGAANFVAEGSSKLPAQP
ncbi:putative peptidoglycan binding protein [Rhodobacter aestuarii]|uniref:Putative peptidoglycan binding domain-containing protein n=1 Tax=Rhodobacter aestuarii TaxID=453582 RepID=A0A1N7L1M9_9RHOB|nr:peptidoglycan-binding domain-containing protein [Rhodobacter aestuarii]PTV95438.1 putative peptidoglycan binding protein [Rhodobacter aestuarii]SIS67758.1 Putative peptidoglycan binding domain-containing protein [Rhodobacter aestuarii]